jgi:ectoine hydroxylase-related dioxygenase (phytanoyl-CoA dioxygenase family)
MNYKIEININEKHKQDFIEKGYAILDKAIDESSLQMLRYECDSLREEINNEMDKNHTSVIGLSHRDSRYFFCAYDKSTSVHSFIFSDLTEEICRSFLGDTAYFFYESFVVKCPYKGMEFSWHQDSGYIVSEHKPYITCWCALDDVDEERGTIFVLPYKDAGTKIKQPHTHIEEGAIEMVGYLGEQKGIPIVASAGSIVVLSSTVFHRSGKNTSPYLRRAYLVDFSCEPIMSSEDPTKYYSRAEPFTLNGHRQRN